MNNRTKRVVRWIVLGVVAAVVVAAAIWLILERFFPDTRMYGFLYFVVSKEWLGAVALLLGASLLGTFLGSIMGFAECWTFDRWDQRRMHLTREQYYAEWESYVDSLDKTENSYITQMSMYFQFESRSAIACVLFGIAWCFYGWSLTEIVGGSLLIVVQPQVALAELEPQLGIAGVLGQ